MDFVLEFDEGGPDLLGSGHEVRAARDVLDPRVPPYLVIAAFRRQHEFTRRRHTSRQREFEPLGCVKL